MFKNIILTTVLALAFTAATNTFAAEDSRQFVKLPEMMQHHMLANMRNHLLTLNEILNLMANGKLDKAADIAEQRLGMSSLSLHGASRMAKFMPKGMQETGTNMHKAASRFARKAQEGALLPAYRSLAEVTTSCVACHTAYRIR
jgi:soluble cytochrome b562